MSYKRIKLSRLNIRIDYELEKQINEEAKLAGLTKTDFIIGAVKVRMERKSLVKKELAKWKRETQIDLRDWEHKQYHRLELLRLNCIHGVFPATKYDNPDGGLFETKLENLNKPTVVAVKDENTNIDYQLEKMMKEVEAIKKAPVKDANTSTL